MNTDEPNDDLLPLLLGICEDFFTGAGPAIHREVDALLQGRCPLPKKLVRTGLP